MIREIAGSIETTVEEIEESGEVLLIPLFNDQVDELWEEIWTLPEGEKQAYTKEYKKQITSWRKRIRKARSDSYELS